MIFINHVLTFIAATSGLSIAYYISKKRDVPQWLIYFIFFLGLSMAIHFYFDSVVDNKINFIKSYINLQPGGNLTTTQRIDKTINAVLNTTQPVNP